MSSWTSYSKCDRCHEPMRVSVVSKFNTDTICLHCSTDEKMAPGYAAADRAECEAVKRGEFNFPGVGLGPRDREFLAARLKHRPLPKGDE